jgi:nicotinamide riboside transporter PnuC
MSDVAVSVFTFLVFDTGMNGIYLRTLMMFWRTQSLSNKFHSVVYFGHMKSESWSCCLILSSLFQENCTFIFEAWGHSSSVSSNSICWVFEQQLSVFYQNTLLIIRIFSHFHYIHCLCDIIHVLLHNVQRYTLNTGDSEQVTLEFSP